MSPTRRELIRTTACAAAASLVGSVARAASPATQTQPTTSAATTRANSRPGIAVIGCGGMTRYHGGYIGKYGDVVALCDVDKGHLNQYNADAGKGKAFCTAHYQEVLTRSDVDAVLIGTPDHWHVKIAADALRAGKDVYCEKPLTLTIDEGRFICRVVRETSRVMQVGTQQRNDEHFTRAVAIAHSGRLGRIRRVTVAVGDTPDGVNFKPSPAPADLDWNLWLGQAPKVEYITQRCHNDFRWWYEYSGGRITDWGAHHVDIAQWAAAPDLPGPMWIEPLRLGTANPLDHGMPTINNAFNTVPKFNIKITFANGVEMFLCDRAPGFPSDNGIHIEGDAGAIFVNRDTLSGSGVDALKEHPLPDRAYPKLNTTIKLEHERHFSNFMDCVKTRATPISDVFTHTRNLATCHLANIACRLNRKIRWDATAQEIVGDAEADSFQVRAQRPGFEVV